MAYITKVTAGGNTEIPVASSLYGTCSTAAATAAKVVTCADFDTLVQGVTIHVLFTNTNTASNPTMNVNSTGAYPILRRTDATAGVSEASSWKAGAMVSFTLFRSNPYAEYHWYMNDFNPVNPAMTASDLTTGTNTNSMVVSPKVIADYVTSQMGEMAGALVYKGTVSAGSELLNVALSKGWYYIVDTAGTYGTATCEPGDMIIVETAGTYTTASALAAAVDVIQTNIDTITNAEIDTIVAS